MKLPITTKELASKRKNAEKLNNLQKFNEKAEISYREFHDDTDIDNFFKSNGAVWDTYTAENFDVAKIADLSLEQKKSFEFYVCGWLQYYDEIVRNDAIKHILYFNWDVQKVEVYICPKPGDSKEPLSCPPAGATSDPKPPTAPPPPYP